ncbi:MAG: type II toxin-antitoxin system ParD family antitoxin [Isosphaeraceae bacterium]|nr:type II toxin-antitoxin system ParD family antitoxin [Isosphaeraceae bacterium]
MNVQLSEHWERFVQDEVRSGRYSSEAAVLEEALTLLKRREQQEARTEVTGITESRSIDAIIDDVMSDLPEEVLGRLPIDGAAQHDHYIYGMPKRSS